MRVGIIGGTGKMGTLFRRIWEGAGYEVQVSGRHTVRSSLDLAEGSDIVMVSVPIRDTVQVIEQISPVLTQRQVLCDLTSIKVKPVEAMLKSPAEVIGLHPMFGPQIPTLEGQPIIACPARCTRKTQETILGMLEREGARIVLSTPEEHDRIMAVIQGLTHFSTLCLAETMRRTDVDLDRALECTSPVYRIEMGLIGRLLGQDPDLYGDILTLNPFVIPVLEGMKDAVQRLGEIVDKGDTDAFRTFFTRNSEKFDRYSEWATHETDAIIEFLVDR